MKKANILPLRTGVGIVLLNDKNDIFVGKRLDNPKDFLEALIRSTLKNRVTYKENFNIVSVDVADASIFDFNMCYEDKIKLINMGYDQKK